MNTESLSSHTGRPVSLQDAPPRDATRCATNKIKTIKIEPLDRGYLVTVGCQSMAIESDTELQRRLCRYINNPAEVEAIFLSGASV